MARNGDVRESGDFRIGEESNILEFVLEAS
jgi:hypothetical protein